MMTMKRASNLSHAPAYGKMNEVRSHNIAAATTTSFTYSSSSSSSSLSSLQSLKEEESEWEMRPGGMLVQKRIAAAPDVSPPPPIFRLRVAFGAARHEISVSSQATFGEVKKLMMAETGIEAREQKLEFKGKERRNGEYLDTCGVKDRSKLTLTEDPASIERRLVEMRRNKRIQTAKRAISDISLELDKLADQVSAMETSITKGVKVSEVQITTLIEMLMRQAIKLDGISAEGDASAQKNLHGKRIQKCVETLDVMKISNSRLKPVVVTTKWETFDFDPPQTTAHWEIFD